MIYQGKELNDTDKEIDNNGECDKNQKGGLETRAASFSDPFHEMLGEELWIK